MTAALTGCSTLALDGFTSSGKTGSDGGDASTDVASVNPDATDGSLNDSPDADAATSFCNGLSPRPEVCLDFDDEPPLGTWVVQAEKGGEVGASTAAYRSAPRAGRFSRPTTGATIASLAATYGFATSTAPTDVEISADLQVLERDDTHSLNLLTVVFPVGGDSYEVQLSMDDGGFVIEQWNFFRDGGTTSTYDSLSRAIPLATWLHVDLSVHLAAPATAKLRIEGALAPEVPLTPPAGLGPPSLQLGDTYVPGGPYTIYFDNVTGRTL